jgi:hypothetical protein
MLHAWLIILREYRSNERKRKHCAFSPIKQTLTSKIPDKSIFKKVTDITDRLPAKILADKFPIRH